MASRDPMPEGSVYVPPITERERIPQEAIDDVVRQIVDKFDPERIILFGSYAYGTPRPESDVDLLVVMDTKKHWIDQEIDILDAIDPDFALDVLVRPASILANRIELGDFFLREITQKGRVVYEHSH